MSAILFYGLLFLLVAIEVVQFSFLKHISSATTLPYYYFMIAGLVFQLFKYPVLHALLKSGDVGAIYVSWSALGILSMSLVAWGVFDERINFYQIGALCIIVMGIVGFYALATKPVEEQKEIDISKGRHIKGVVSISISKVSKGSE